MSINFHFLIPESLHTKSNSKMLSGFWEKLILISICKWPWAKAKKWHWSSIHVLTCLQKLKYISAYTNLQVTRCKWKICCFHFSYRKVQLQNLTLPLNRSRLNQGHHLNKLWWAGVPNDTYQVLWYLVHQFWRRFLKAFYHIWAWQPSWSCKPDAENKTFVPTTHRGSTQNLALIGQVVSEKMFKHWGQWMITTYDKRQSMGIL